MILFQISRGNEVKVEGLAWNATTASPPRSLTIFFSDMKSQNITIINLNWVKRLFLALQCCSRTFGAIYEKTFR